MLFRSPKRILHGTLRVTDQANHIRTGGTAQISSIHANIMVNLGRATSADVIGLIRHAQRAVKDSLGFNLEPEINFVGEF